MAEPLRDHDDTGESQATRAHVDQSASNDDPPALAATDGVTSQVSDGAAPVAPAAPASREPKLFGALARFFWMGPELARARERHYGPGHPGWKKLELALSARAHADQIRQSGGRLGAAMLLYRAAVGLLIRAQLDRAGVRVPADLPDDLAWARMRELAVGDGVAVRLSASERDLVSSCLSVQGEGNLAALPASERKAALMALRRLARALGDPLEQDAKGVRRVLCKRWAKVTIALVVLVMVIRPLFGGGGASNLAFHQRVLASSQSPAFAPNLGRLVDGDLGTLAFHSVGENPWVAIDLGSLHRISRVIVHNRVDCCQERAVPLAIEVSSNGIDYRRIAGQNTTFSRWIAKFRPVQARYVRLSLLKRDTFHLTEVEVYE